MSEQRSGSESEAGSRSDEERRRGKAGREPVATSGGEPTGRAVGHAEGGGRQERRASGLETHEDETILRIEYRKLAKRPISRYGAKVSGPIVEEV
jgi:hypothetical protein